MVYANNYLSNIVTSHLREIRHKLRHHRTLSPIRYPCLQTRRVPGCCTNLPRTHSEAAARACALLSPIGSLGMVSRLVLGGRYVADHVWINSAFRGYFQWACKFWIETWQGGVICSLQSNCGHLTNNPTLCKIVRTSGEVPGSHFDRAVNSLPESGLRGYLLNWIPFRNTNANACDSSLVHHSGKPLWGTLRDCPSIKTGCNSMVIVLKMTVLSANLRKWKLTNFKSALEYAEYISSVSFVTSYVKNRVLLLKVSLFWTKSIAQFLIGDNFFPMKKSVRHRNILIVCSIAKLDIFPIYQ